jgi:hypothetical protein
MAHRLGEEMEKTPRDSRRARRTQAGREGKTLLYARAALYPEAELSVDLAMRARSTFESHDYLV